MVRTLYVGRSRRCTSRNGLDFGSYTVLEFGYGAHIRSRLQLLDGRAVRPYVRSSQITTDRRSDGQVSTFLSAQP